MVDSSGGYESLKQILRELLESNKLLKPLTLDKHGLVLVGTSQHHLPKRVEQEPVKGQLRDNKRRGHIGNNDFESMSASDYGTAISPLVSCFELEDPVGTNLVV